MQSSIILFRGENSTLTKSQVSFPVAVDKKLIAQIVGDFSLIPTNAIDQIGLIGSTKLKGIRDCGLRNMDDGTARAQSWCRDCRKEPRNGVNA